MRHFLHMAHPTPFSHIGNGCSVRHGAAGLEGPSKGESIPNSPSLGLRDLRSQSSSPIRPPLPRLGCRLHAQFRAPLVSAEHLLICGLAHRLSHISERQAEQSCSAFSGEGHSVAAWAVSFRSRPISGLLWPESGGLPWSPPSPSTRCSSLSAISSFPCRLPRT